MSTKLRILLPFVVVLGGFLLTVVMIKTRPPVEHRRPEPPLPVVEVQEVHPGTHTFRVKTHGTVTARTEIVLVAEVTGRIVEVSPALEAGGFFEEGEVLARVDPRDYELALKQAEAELAREELLLAQEEAAAEVARREWERLGQGKASPLTLHEPQLAQARARVEAARAAVERARRDLERTRIVAPFTGRVREKLADRGQFVSPGTPVARVFAVDYAQVRLPIEDRDLALLDLSITTGAEAEIPDGPPVVLRAEFGGEAREWRARIVRTEGILDPKTRMVYLVARVEDPYGLRSGRPPLPVGLFVEAEILGRTVPDVVVLPHHVLQDGDAVLLVDAEDRIRRQPVRVLQDDGETAVLAGLQKGQRVCLTRLGTVVEGMRVRVQEATGEPVASDGGN
jgi:RND family efflux transporter MFP subunit